MSTMKKKKLFTSLIICIGLFVGTNSCRESFEFDDFDNPKIQNQIPTPTIDVVNAISGVEMSAFDLRKVLTDPEGDPYEILSVSSENPDVATLSFDDPNATFTEIGTGTSTISINVDDGTEREDNEVSFDLEIAEPDHQVTIGFQSVPNNTSFNGVEGIGGTFDYVEGSGETEVTVNNWVLALETDEYAAFEISLDEPTDLSSDATLSFEYSDLNDPIFGIGVFDAHGGELWLGDEAGLPGIILDSSEFNTFSIDLKDYADESFDFSSVVGVCFEKWGGHLREESDPLHSFKLKRFKMGEL